MLIYAQSKGLTLFLKYSLIVAYFYGSIDLSLSNKTDQSHERNLGLIYSGKSFLHLYPPEKKLKVCQLNCLKWF